MMDRNSVGKGVVFLYIEAFTMLFSGYIYWLILSKIIDPSSIGIASTIIALSTIIVSIASMGVANGIQRYLSNNIAENKQGNIKGIINSSLLITIIGIIISTIIILIYNSSISSYFNIDFEYIIIAIFLYIFLVFTSLMRAIIIPSLKIKIITLASVVSTIVKISVTIYLVLADFGVLGIMVGFLLYPITSLILFIIAIKKKVYNNIQGSGKLLYTKDIFITSLSFWIPAIISTIGSQLGTITVFLQSGSSSAGIYFISFSLVTGLTVIISVLSSIAYPTISALKDGKKRATWRLIKISLIMTLPISNAILFYSTDILSLFGEGYKNGSSILQILLLTSLPTALSTGIGVLLYAYGNNKEFLILGLVTSIPRVVLYFIFVPPFGGDGAALSYLIGSMFGGVLSIWMAQKIKINLFYKKIMMLFLIPILIGIPFKYMELNYIISILTIIFSSYLIYTFFKIVDSEDFNDILKLFPSKMSLVLLNIVTKYSKKNKK